MAMMTAEQARQLGDEFRPQFSSVEDFEVSWRRLFEKLKTPSAESARRWLTEDLAADSVMAGALVREPLLPVRQQFAVDDESACSTCKGKRYVRHDVDVTHPLFGKAIRCPRCRS